MMNKLRSYLKQPYPIDTRGNWRIALLTGIFISLFMAGFEPFGLSRVQIDHKKLIFAGYGAVTLIILFLVIVALPLTFRSYFNEKHWNIGKHIIYFLFIFFTIGLANLIYSGLIFHFSPLNFKRFIFFEIFTLIVGSIPVSFIILWKYNKFLKQNLQSANELSSHLDKDKSSMRSQSPLLFEFSSHNDKNRIRIHSDHLLFIESDGNYCNIYHVEGEKVKKSVLRTTLKGIENTLPEASGLYKTHRAYIINPDKVEKIKGNAQGYRLAFHNLNKEAAVSRQYIAEFRKRMQKQESF